jgi:hypothetical protein
MKVRAMHYACIDSWLLPDRSAIAGAYFCLRDRHADVPAQQAGIVLRQSFPGKVLCILFRHCHCGMHA